ncbi:hypothetical protein PGT21_004086 [Puccinia graminis f. sp. tritici]|uniref:Uncharacterized protein n=1 Tax=Puccinia graminis f. sp. tritici TaxID=56615 RepID=A0A5B0MVH2_PUCGR|nr:hypothetical protein PGTUg99_019820 [Puccinia graminis f. sp. tritici]KAA1103903.1 hypothetical protein PGT21_004086 [Puccinia graminis f. sp. tritici]
MLAAFLIRTIHTLVAMRPNSKIATLHRWAPGNRLSPSHCLPHIYAPRFLAGSLIFRRPGRPRFRQIITSAVASPPSEGRFATKGDLAKFEAHSALLRRKFRGDGGFGCHGTQLPNRGLSQADVPTTAQSAAESRAESELPFYLGDRSDSPARDSSHCRIVACGQDGQKAQMKPQIARPGDFRLEFANLVVDQFTSDHNPYLKARVQAGLINHRHPAVLSTLDSQGTSTVTILHQQIININEVESRIENQRGITCTSQVADQLQQAMPVLPKRCQS